MQPIRYGPALLTFTQFRFHPPHPHIHTPDLKKFDMCGLKTGVQLQTTRRKSSSLPKKVPDAHARVYGTAATTSPMTCSSQVKKTDMAVKVPRKTRSLLTPPYWSRSSSYFPSDFPHFFINCNFSNVIISTIRTALSETLDHSLYDFRVGIS